MQIFNTMTRQKEEFVPQKEGEYRIYVCGPTVYNYIHIGNARPMIVFDTLRRYLEYCGNKVYYVSNITDIDDKLIKKGQEEGTSMQEVARKFEAEYIRDSDGLNVKAPTVRPRATEHIGEIIHIVKDLVDSGHAYVARNGDVYFRVKSDPGYGKLSHLNLDDLESGNRELRSRMDDDLKEDPADFAVWKAAKPGEPYWESPWGHGRPGWHIECSAMARKHLGKTIDLHAGGQDLIFPHQQRCRQTAQKHGRTHNRRGYHREEGPAGKLPHPGNHQRGNCQNRSSCRCGHHNRQKNPFQFLHIHDLPSYFWYINMSSKAALGQKKRKRCTRLLKSPPERTTILILVILVNCVHAANRPALNAKLRLIAAGLDHDRIRFVLHRHNPAADTANRGDLIPYLGVLPHFGLFLLLFALGTEEDKIQGHNKDCVHQQHGNHAETAALSRSR